MLRVEDKIQLKTSVKGPEMTEIYSIENLDVKIDAKQALECKKNS